MGWDRRAAMRPCTIARQPGGAAQWHMMPLTELLKVQPGRCAAQSVFCLTRFKKYTICSFFHNDLNHRVFDNLFFFF